MFISFKYKILGLFSALIIGVLGGILLVVNHIYYRRAHDDIEIHLKQTQLIFEQLLNQRNRQLATYARLLSFDFAFKQAVATSEHATVLSAARNHQARVGSDLFIVTDRFGTVLADTYDWNRFGDDISTEPWIQAALYGDEHISLSLLEDNLYQIISLPLLAPDVIGTLNVGFRIDDGVAANLQQMTLSEVSFLVGPRVIASTLQGNVRQDLERQLAERNQLQIKSDDLFEIDLMTGGEKERFKSILGSISSTMEDSEAEIFGDFKSKRLKEQLQTVGLDSDLAHPQSLQEGRRVLFKKCIVCHDYQQILKYSRRTPSAWYLAVQNMREIVENGVLLFRTNLAFQGELDSRGGIPKDLRKVFRKNGVPLSRDATVSIETETRNWVITDKKKKKTYVIRRDEEQLNIYEDALIGEPLTQRESELVTAYLINLTLDARAGQEIKADDFETADESEMLRGFGDIESTTAMEPESTDTSGMLTGFGGAEAAFTTESDDTSDMLSAFGDTEAAGESHETDTTGLLSAFGESEGEPEPSDEMLSNFGDTGATNGPQVADSTGLLSAFDDNEDKLEVAERRGDVEDGRLHEGVGVVKRNVATGLVQHVSQNIDVSPSYLIQDSLDQALAPLKEIQKNLFIIGIGAIAISIGFALVISIGVTSAVRHLVRGTEEVVTGNYEYRLDIPQRDEIGQLATHFNAMVTGLRDKERIRGLMDKVVSKEIAAELLKGEVKLGGETRKCTVLFSDIRSWTTISEKLEPEVLVEMLNGYLTLMSKAIENQLGVIDKYIGDAIVALFGAPVGHRDDTRRAVDAALEMRRCLGVLNAEREKNGEFPLETGIGISAGLVLAGNIGSDTRLNYTVMGDTVNLAARLETLTKLYGAGIIVPESVRNEIGADCLYRELDLIQVKGKTESVRIFEVLTRHADKELLQHVEYFENGLACYRQQNWAQAEEFFTQTLGGFRNDLASTLYLERIQHCRKFPPPPNWDGVFVAIEKYDDNE
ncbi:MAG: HAMP domain-containing protein [Candidatus Poribacteria bacterium]|nr:HAMP domain-containing protein [Candidatus Poribacteria bacterium]